MRLLKAAVACALMFGPQCAAAPPPASGRTSSEERTSAGGLLGALDLLQVSSHDGPGVVRLPLTSKPSPDIFSNRGRAILQLELVNADIVALADLDLLYNDLGRLIAVFPVIPAAIMERGPQTREKWAPIRPRYFDFSPFYLDVPRMEDPKGYEKWRAFTAQYARDRAAIKAFMSERFGFLSRVYPELWRSDFPYRLHEIDTATGDWEVHGFDPLVFADPVSGGPLVCDMEPGEFTASYRKVMPGKRRTVIPGFPTVYTLANTTPDEIDYLRQAFKKFDLAPDSKLLMVGPGTGVDTWVISLRTKAPVYVIGINPLEVANTVETARIAGFEVRALTGDNVADELGRPRFPDVKFDAVYWNMPAYWPAPTPGATTPLTGVWDGDLGGPILERFARALPVILKPAGRALIWNQAFYEKGRNVVADILASAGTPSPVFSVEDRRYPKPKRQKAESWYDGHLYTLSRLR